ncbi:NAD(P)-dependent alcohol dehydrogenase [Chelativorans salis]|uniref:NAD(P)-dependent alcohol dehydrogenase n=1 Tax=Chelativorans salis TaxID=2978478 RepID=A0ABT2LP61_9HYPH|nr:NAD(P)-dependent alcohol dehydrogenase [Chelativorans sp. EGI FJ00035]MCT7376342.1 NAD(P)-dependent alcohol dehydrogenase [Chelativorans sp. EGI FJ00035]
MKQTMLAVTRETYGGPDVMCLSRVDRPIPKADQVLVEVEATSVNPFDWHQLTGRPWLVRLPALFKPSVRILGADIAGTVVAVGDQIQDFKPGEAVFGDINFGAFAQFAIAQPHMLARRPDGVTVEDAGVVGIAGLTALQAVRDWGRVQAGEKVLINGASGGVGAYAVQIAIAFGAEVTGVCSAANTALVRRLGADRVIDYKSTDFATEQVRYDVVIDLVANRGPRAIGRILADNGRWVLVALNIPRFLVSSLFGRWLLGGSNKTTTFKIAEIRQDDLATLARMLAEGQIRSVIDRSFSLEDVPKAMSYLATKRAKGKVAIRLE